MRFSSTRILLGNASRRRATTGCNAYSPADRSFTRAGVRRGGVLRPDHAFAVADPGASAKPHDFTHRDHRSLSVALVIGD
jgi:hypothetical protein